MTPAEYIRLEEQTGQRYEYRDGQAFAIGQTALPHNLIAAKLNRKIGSLIEGKGCEVVGSDQKVIVLATGLEIYPDVSVYCGQPHLAGANSLALANPILLAEVSPPPPKPTTAARNPPTTAASSPSKSTSSSPRTASASNATAEPAIATGSSPSSPP
jgi:Uma2 family endonuclease